MASLRDVPKYQWIRDEIFSWLQSGQIRPGDKLPIEAQLATRFSASKQTIRQAVGELVARGFLERIQGSGTYYTGHPTTDTHKPVSGIVGVITTYISDYIFPHIIRGIEERLSENGYSPLLFTTQNDFSREGKALKDILSKGVDGIITEATKSSFTNPNMDLYEQLKARGIPVVMLHATYPNLNMPVIEVDDRKGAYLAVRHLIDMGHRHIGAILKVDDKQGLRRMEGFLQALNESGYTYDSDHLAFFSTEQQTVIAVNYVHSLLKMESKRRPTAVFCYNDSIATYLLTTLREYKISVPDNISIIGFDDAPMSAKSYPQLTTVEHPKHEMGTFAGDLMLQMINRQPVSQHIFTYTPKLVIRSSVRSLHTVEVL